MAHGRDLGERVAPTSGELARKNATAVTYVSTKTYVCVRDLEDCSRCGALVEVDCREADGPCPGDPDQQLFAPYMGPHRRYDLRNCYDRDIIRLSIIGFIRRCRDYHALCNRLLMRGALSETEYGDRSSGVLATLQRHLGALARINELEGNEQ